jgi:hemerythrin-like domain-containing protein
MNRQDVAQQTQVEQELLRHIMEGLRISAGWQVQGGNATRKLSTLQFVVQSFQRHLERLLALEEHDGYMDMVVSCAPTLGRATDALRREHDQFRTAARQFVSRLERITPTETAALDAYCNDLLALLDRIEAHNRKEVSLLQEALRDEGGEG